MFLVELHSYEILLILVGCAETAGNHLEEDRLESRVLGFDP